MLKFRSKFFNRNAVTVANYFSTARSSVEYAPKEIKIVEVGARDGLQNEKEIVPTDKKIEFINKLSETGLSVIEATSFVSSEWIPQLSDSTEVMQKINRKNSVQYPVLVPTLKYLETAMKCNVSEVAFFTAASETFNQKNVNCSIEKSLQRLQGIAKVAKGANIKIRGYISCVVGCPYEGAIKPAAVTKVAESMVNLGCYEISLGDTIGVGTVGSISKMLQAVLKQVPSDNLAIHCHDTYGQALANIYCSLQLGIKTVDSSVAGLGGCPYAKGATGNVATEDVVYMLDGLGVKTGVDMTKLLEVSKFISDILKKPPKSRVALAKFGSTLCY